MADWLPIQFEQPAWLFLLLLIIPVYLIGRRSIGGLSRGKATVVFALRVLVIVLLTTVLARPIWEQHGEGVTVTVLLDRSQSIPLPLKQQSLEFMRTATEHRDSREPEDRVAVVTLAKDAAISALPDRLSRVTIMQDPADLTATNLAAGVNLALTLAPPDTSNRIVLVSDGNETIDHVLAAAEVARAGGVPIDVLLLEYEYENEVLFDQIVAPARARLGQTANLKMVLRSQSTIAGNVVLSMNGIPLDLNGDAPGEGMRIELDPGTHTIPITVALDEHGPQQFEAVFEPDDPSMDMIDRNNTAMAVTFVSGEGKILIVDEGATESQYLVDALTEAGISVDVAAPGGVQGLIFLSAYDGVVLANIPRTSFDDQQVKDLHAYVHDLGGGLAMLGGPNSFGAGGWIDSELAKVLPVNLDPPQSRQMPRGALALIMHSCEMPQGNFWGQKVAESAINALSRLDYVGIVEFNWQAGANNLQGCSWAHPMSLAGDKTAALAATKKMVVGDMPAFGPSMQLAHQGLTGVRAGQRHAIIISDGDPQPPPASLIQSYIDAQVTVTTVMIAGHGTAMHLNQMRNIATKTGGRFYNITNPKNLPQIFIKEAMLVSRSLIQEGDTYEPVVVSRLPGPTEGFDDVPAVDGYVLTAPREGLAQLTIVNPTSEGNDPIYAYWNYGLGKSIAYTSDITGRWGSRWVSWASFQNFWEQSVRWMMRPSSPANMIVNTRLDGDVAVVEIEALESDASFLNFLNMSGLVLSPSSEPVDLDLQQTGPGRYRGEFQVDEAGAYLVNVRYATGSDASQQGSLQAAVTVPYSREFRTVKHNAALLSQLADRTDGRMLSADDPSLADLFNREELDVPKIPSEIWDILAIIAASIFLLDVASRRLTIDPKWVAGLFGRAVGRRQDKTEETVAAWKRARSQVAHRRERAGATKEKADKSVRYEAADADARHAIDVGSEQPQDMRPSMPKRDAPRPQPDAPGAEDEGDYTSRLLAAKRRAREEKKENDQTDGGGDG